MMGFVSSLGTTSVVPQAPQMHPTGGLDGPERFYSKALIHDLRRIGQGRSAYME